MPVPPSVIDFLKHDSNLNLSFDVSTCTARKPSAGKCQGYLSGTSLDFSTAPRLAGTVATTSSSSFTTGDSTHVEKLGLLDGTPTTFRATMTGMSSNSATSTLEDSTTTQMSSSRSSGQPKVTSTATTIITTKITTLTRTTAVQSSV